MVNMLDSNNINWIKFAVLSLRKYIIKLTKAEDSNLIMNIDDKILSLIMQIFLITNDISLIVRAL